VTRNYATVIIVPALDLFHATGKLLGRRSAPDAIGAIVNHEAALRRGGLYDQNPGFPQARQGNGPISCWAQSQLQMTCGLA